MVEVRYNYRLRVKPREAQLLQGIFDSCRFVWNQALGRWSDLWRHEAFSYSYGDGAAELTHWRSRFDWLASQPQCPQQQTLRHLFRSISAFFDKADLAGKPHFKARKSDYATAEWTKNGFNVTGSGLGRPDDRLRVATAAGRLELRVVWSRPLPTPPSSVTVRKDAAGHWWASFVVRFEVPDAPVAPTGCSTGLDVGLTTFATTEDPSNDVANPRFGRAAAKTRARSQRNMAGKMAGSKHRAHAKRLAAQVAAKVANQRSEFHHKAARQLVANYDRIGVEDLRVQNLSRRGKGRKKSGLNRAIADAGRSQFRAILQWQTTKAGKEVVVLPARDTTQTCSGCGARAKPRIELSDRVYRCQACGLVLGSEPVGAASPVGDDGKKSKVLAGILAA